MSAAQTMEGRGCRVHTGFQPTRNKSTTFKEGYHVKNQI